MRANENDELMQVPHRICSSTRWHRQGNCRTGFQFHRISVKDERYKMLLERAANRISKVAKIFRPTEGKHDGNKMITSQIIKYLQNYKYRHYSTNIIQ